MIAVVEGLAHSPFVLFMTGLAIGGCVVAWLGPKQD